MKRLLFELTLPAAVKRMREEQTIRFGKEWLKDDAGHKRRLIPTRDLAKFGVKLENGRFTMDQVPTTEDKLMFIRRLEQIWIGLVRSYLDANADILTDARAFLSRERSDDALADVEVWFEDTDMATPARDGLCIRPEMSRIEWRPYHEWQREFDAAINSLVELDPLPESLRAALDIVYAIKSGEQAWSRNHTRREDRVKMFLRFLVREDPQAEVLLHQACHAALAMRAIAERRADLFGAKDATSGHTDPVN